MGHSGESMSDIGIGYSSESLHDVRVMDGLRFNKKLKPVFRSAADFTVSFGKPCRQVELAPGGAARKLTFNARLEYVRLVKEAYLHRYDTQIQVWCVSEVPHLVCATGLIKSRVRPRPVSTLLSDSALAL